MAVTTEINLHLPALLPDDYCGDIHERLVLYKRLANCDQPRATGRTQGRTDRPLRPAAGPGAHPAGAASPAPGNQALRHRPPSGGAGRRQHPVRTQPVHRPDEADQTDPDQAGIQTGRAGPAEDHEGQPHPGSPAGPGGRFPARNRVSSIILETSVDQCGLPAIWTGT
jgi:hypothetical protein